MLVLAFTSFTHINRNVMLYLFSINSKFFVENLCTCTKNMTTPIKWGWRIHQIYTYSSDIWYSSSFSTPYNSNKK